MTHLARHFKSLALVAAAGLLVVGCGGSDSTTATVPGTTATVPGTTVEVPAASSVIESATSVAGEAVPPVSSAAEDLRQRLESSLPGLQPVIDDVQRADDGTVTVQTSLAAGDSIAGIAKDQCSTVLQSMGESATQLVILGSDGGTIASC